MNNIKIISIEGNIGSGKSTVVNNLKDYYSENKPLKGIYFLEEPVSEWVQIQDSTGKNIIEKFYENQKRYSFSFQMMAYISRLAMLKRAVKECQEKEHRIIVCERSLQTDKNVFCKMLYDSGKIEDVEFQIYNKWFDEFIKEIPKIHFIYIVVDPKIAYERIIQRSRKGETIEPSYLQMCSDYHDSWLKSNNQNIIINGNKSSVEVFNEISNTINNL